MVSGANGCKPVETQSRNGKENDMRRLERIARRALQWADAYRREGDADGVAMAMGRFRKAQRRISEMVESAFAPRIEIGMGVLA